MSRKSARVDWRREMAVGAARHKGAQYANVIMLGAIARRAAFPALVALAVVVDLAVLASATRRFVESTLLLSLGLSLALIVACVVAYRRLSLSRGWYMPVANWAAVVLGAIVVSLGGSTVIVWLAS